jgi:hypothetical protein
LTPIPGEEVANEDIVKGYKVDTILSSRSPKKNSRTSRWKRPGPSGDNVVDLMEALRKSFGDAAAATQAPKKPARKSPMPERRRSSTPQARLASPKAVLDHFGFVGSMVMRGVIICGDYKGSNLLFFFSDMGWMVGAMCACIPSFAGGSLLVAEGTPDYPDTGRFWRLIEEHKSSRQA